MTEGLHDSPPCGENRQCAGISLLAMIGQPPPGSAVLPLFAEQTEEDTVHIACRAVASNPFVTKNGGMGAMPVPPLD